jgi:glycosyltransferase involved in cell wall biosynthesis
VAIAVRQTVTVLIETVNKKTYLVFSATIEGGLAEHIYYQARTLQENGHRVYLLAPKNFLPGRTKQFMYFPILKNMQVKSRSWLIKRLMQIWVLCLNYFYLAFYTVKLKPTFVLIDSYREYLAVLWAWPLRLALKMTKAICIVNLHDPVRDFVIGPVWWHNWSVRSGYSFINIGLVHSTVPEKANIPASVKLVEVPVGIYDLPEATMPINDVRKKWNANPDQKVFLSFGYIRDNKNIDLLIKALPQVAKAFLVVAGKPQSIHDKPMHYYENLARELGVINRCYFLNEFIVDEELGNFFRSVDFVALTYSSSFHSQSGVLNLAAASRLRVLASGADSPLVRSVKQYKLGEVVEADSKDAIVAGMNKLIYYPVDADWEAYYRYAGWSKNVRSMEVAALKAADNN